jgi:hypothetical protein
MSVKAEAGGSTGPRCERLPVEPTYPVGIQSNRRATDSRAYPAGGADTLWDSISTNVNPIVSPRSRDTSIVATVDNVNR